VRGEIEIGSYLHVHDSERVYVEVFTHDTYTHTHTHTYAYTHTHTYTYTYTHIHITHIYVTYMFLVLLDPHFPRPHHPVKFHAHVGPAHLRMAKSRPLSVPSDTSAFRLPVPERARANPSGVARASLLKAIPVPVPKPDYNVDDPPIYTTHASMYVCMIT